MFAEASINSKSSGFVNYAGIPEQGCKKSVCSLSYILYYSFKKLAVPLKITILM